MAGTLVTIIYWIFGSMVNPGEFAFSRWMSIFVDIVALPVLIPLLIYLLLIGLRILSGTPNFANFTLLWLFPISIYRSLEWSSSGDPLLLVLVPVLWVCIAAGIPFLIKLMLDNSIFIAILCGIGILAIPIAATTSYWAFYSHRLPLAYLLLLPAVTPLITSIVYSVLFSRR